jgi:hypothetical protein
LCRCQVATRLNLNRFSLLNILFGNGGLATYNIGSPCFTVCPGTTTILLTGPLT